MLRPEVAVSFPVELLQLAQLFREGHPAQQFVDARFNLRLAGPLGRNAAQVGDYQRRAEREPQQLRAVVGTINPDFFRHYCLVSNASSLSSHQSKMINEGGLGVTIVDHWCSGRNRMWQ
jgi:hypothetical protein